MAKNRSPQDATLRNVRAAKKRDTKLETHVKALDFAIEELMARFDAVCERLTRVEERLDYVASSAVLTDAMPRK